MTINAEAEKTHKHLDEVEVGVSNQMDRVAREMDRLKFDVAD